LCRLRRHALGHGRFPMRRKRTHPDYHLYSHTVNMNRLYYNLRHLERKATFGYGTFGHAMILEHLNYKLALLHKFTQSESKDLTMMGLF
jgi:hypothetical protein